ncbi:MAG: histidine triad nucleotide-binding protein [Clostridia bacterium]|nr:histidine triad nucleotide-binding protein [Clostridia bacterium]
MDCLFCKIIAGEIPSDKVYEDEQVLAFRDIAPKAPVHVLFIPKTHLAGARDVTADNAAVVAHIFTVIPQVAAQLGVTDYRIITNNGASAGQSVDHLHFHLLGGRTLGEMG